MIVKVRLALETKEDSKKPKLTRATWEPWSIFWLVVILLCFAGMFFGMYRLRSSQNGPFRDEYEGHIVDKWANFSESQTVSEQYYRLLVEADDGRRFPVAISSEMYERARVSMRIKKSKSGVELIPEDQRQHSH